LLLIGVCLLIFNTFSTADRFYAALSDRKKSCLNPAFLHLLRVKILFRRLLLEMFDFCYICLEFYLSPCKFHTFFLILPNICVIILIFYVY